MVPFAAYERLVNQLAALKRDGWVPPEVYEQPSSKGMDLPAAIEQAIVTLGVDAQTERHLRGEAWQMIRAKVDEAEIVQRITEGESVEL